MNCEYCGTEILPGGAEADLVHNHTIYRCRDAAARRAGDLYALAKQCVGQLDLAADCVDGEGLLDDYEMELTREFNRKVRAELARLSACPN